MKPVILLFPGQGSQTVGMGLALADAFPEAKAVFDTADAALDGGITSVIRTGPQETLTVSSNAQPAITTVNLAVLAVLRARGIAPVAAAGHSLGEYSACACAGVFDTATAVRLTRKRGQLMQECAIAHPGAMVAVMGLAPEAIDTACAEAAKETGLVASVANYNNAEQIVITGDAVAVRKAAERCTAAGAKRCVDLPVAGAFHSALMKDAENGFKPVLDATTFANPAIPVYANIDASEKTAAAAVKDALVRQICGSVRWMQTIAALRARFPEAAFVECGPGKVLRGLMRRLDKDAVALNVEDTASLDATLAALA